MKLKDLLPDEPVHVEYRTVSPEGLDLLYGYCMWNGKELISEDGDDYDIEDDLSGHMWSDSEHLTVWFKSEWITG